MTIARSFAPAWSPRYPDPDVIRAETRAMADCFISALIEQMPPDSVTGVFAKGSAFKPWDSPIDYVPEINDVDLHVRFSPGRPENQKGFEVDLALEIAAGTGERYRAAIPNPVHVPRLQFIPLEFIRALPRYVPSPASTIHAMLGSLTDEPALSLEASRESALTNLLETRPYLAHLGDQVIDKPGQYKREVLRQLVWRVSPAGPRALEVLGAPFEDAWSANRTGIVVLLQSVGEADMASSYVDFYLCAWDYFLSGYTDDESARKAIRAGALVIARSIEIAEAKL